MEKCSEFVGCVCPNEAIARGLMAQAQKKGMKAKVCVTEDNCLFYLTPNGEYGVGAHTSYYDTHVPKHSIDFILKRIEMYKAPLKSTSHGDLIVTHFKDEIVLEEGQQKITIPNQVLAQLVLDNHQVKWNQ